MAAGALEASGLPGIAVMTVSKAFDGLRRCDSAYRKIDAKQVRAALHEF
jgi:hypothetical protein